MSYQIRLEKENFKFSCSHFTILSSGHAERLHGHNYYVRVELDVASLDPSLGMAFDFNVIKPLVRETAEALDEYVLLPERSPYLKIESESGVVRAQFANKRYELPAEDVQILHDAVNITSEELARWFANALVQKLRATELFARIQALSVAIEETRGQSVSYEIKL